MLKKNDFNAGTYNRAHEIRESVLDYFQQGWTVMRLLPELKEPDKTKTHDALTITSDNLDTLAANENLGVRFTLAGALKDLDLDYDCAADLAKTIGMPQATAAFGRGSIIGHLLYNAPGAEAKEFNLPDVKNYPRDLPIHNGKPSLKVLEIRGSNNTYTMFPPSIHPCGDKLTWFGTQRKPKAITAKRLRQLAGVHAVASAVLYFYPTNAASRFEVRMALAGTLLRTDISTNEAQLYVRQVARLGGDEKWNEDFTETTEKRFDRERPATGLPKLIEALGLPKICEDTFREWLQDEVENPFAGKTIEPVNLWGHFDPPTLPHGLLPPIIVQFALEQATLMGADPTGIAVGALVVCAAALPDHIKIKVKRHDPNWTESARLWVGLIGDPSSKKTPTLLLVSKPLQRLDAELFRAYVKAQQIYDNLSKDERKHAEPPKQRRLRLEDTTIEAAQEVLKDSPDGVLCLQDEMSGWFGGMDKYASARGAQMARGFWLRSYNGLPYPVNRINRGSFLIENLSVSLLGGIQPEPIRKLVADTVDDGLIQRLIPIVLRPGTIGQDAPMNTQTATDYEKLITRLHKSVAQFEPLRFSDEALAIRVELEQKHVDLIRCEAINKKLGSHIGKYDGLFARPCLLWHAIEGAPEGEITVQTARRVADFMHKFLLPHAISFYAGMLGLSDDHERLTAVAGYILAHKLDLITNRDVQRGDRTMRSLERPEIDRIFEQLDALGWVSRIPGRRLTDPPHWLVNPEVHRRFAERAAREAEGRAQEREMLKVMFARRAD